MAGQRPVAIRIGINYCPPAGRFPIAEAMPVLRSSFATEDGEGGSIPPSRLAVFTSSRKPPADSMTWSAVTVTLDLNENPGDLCRANRKLIPNAVGRAGFDRDGGFLGQQQLFGNNHRRRQRVRC